MSTMAAKPLIPLLTAKPLNHAKVSGGERVGVRGSENEKT